MTVLAQNLDAHASRASPGRAAIQFMDQTSGIGRVWLALDPVLRDHGIDGDNFLFRVTAFQALEGSVFKSFRPF